MYICFLGHLSFHSQMQPMYVSCNIILDMAGNRSGDALWSDVYCCYVHEGCHLLVPLPHTRVGNQCIVEPIAAEIVVTFILFRFH